MPGPSSKYETTFVVVLNGCVLEFRSSFSQNTEGDSAVIKEVSGKQSITLPSPPDLAHVSAQGSYVVVRKAPPADSPFKQADVILRISQ